MENKSEATMSNNSSILNLISWLFGLAVIMIGFINLFWGNDPGFGIFLLLLSLVYFPPLTAFFKEKTGLPMPRIVKVLLGVFILWAALGVGELFDKINLMMEDL